MREVFLFVFLRSLCSFHQSIQGLLARTGEAHGDHRPKSPLTTLSSNEPGCQYIGSPASPPPRPRAVWGAVWGVRYAVTGYQDPLKASKSSRRTLFQHLVQH